MQKIKNTRKRSQQQEAILRLLKSTKAHPSADWIFTQIKLELPGTGLATVYRNLKILKETGQVIELRGNDGSSHFDGNTQSHYHFHCDACGIILDLNEPVDISFENKIALKTGLKVTRHQVVIQGLCVDCQKHETERKNQT
jgi:Fur family transcriptional regulator, peroxide stress response regulator